MWSPGLGRGTSGEEQGREPEISNEGPGEELPWFVRRKSTSRTRWDPDSKDPDGFDSCRYVRSNASVWTKKPGEGRGIAGASAVREDKCRGMRRPDESQRDKR